MASKGDSVDIPLTGNALVTSAAADNAQLTVQRAGVSTLMNSNGTYLLQAGAGGSTANGLYADLSSVSAVTINQLRLATQMQRALEKRCSWRYSLC